MKYFAHETAVIDEGCQIGEGTKVWHFSHIMSDAIVGERCNIGQNVVISPEVILGKNVKIQNKELVLDDDNFYILKLFSMRPSTTLWISRHPAQIQQRLLEPPLTNIKSDVAM